MEKERQYHTLFRKQKPYWVHIREEAVTHFHERLKGLEVYKSVIRLKFDHEMPLSLITDIAKWSFAKERL